MQLVEHLIAVETDNNKEIAAMHKMVNSINEANSVAQEEFDKQLNLLKESHIKLLHEAQEKTNIELQFLTTEIEAIRGPRPNAIAIAMQQKLKENFDKAMQDH